MFQKLRYLSLPNMIVFRSNTSYANRKIGKKANNCSIYEKKQLIKGLNPILILCHKNQHQHKIRLIIIPIFKLTLSLKKTVIQSSFYAKNIMMHLLLVFSCNAARYFRLRDHMKEERDVAAIAAGLPVSNK